MKIHKTASTKEYLRSLGENPLTVCGINESYTKHKDGSLFRGYRWHFRWAQVTCKKCLRMRK